MNKIKVIIDSSEKNSNLLYKSNHYCIDQFIFIEAYDKRIGWLPSTELEKAKKTSSLNEVYNLSDALEEIKKDSIYPYLKSSILIKWLKKNNINEIIVPYDFPLIEADNLREFGINVVPVKEPFYEERVIKSEAELDYIRENSRKNALVMKEISEILHKSRIADDNRLIYDNEFLTSEKIQDMIIISLFEKNLISYNVIAACGDQGCDPHEYGTGYLYANKSIIVDIFPRNRYNLYYTDMTRTFCKGSAASDLKKMYNAVLEAQNICLDRISADAEGDKIHKEIQEYFLNKGYKTGIINNVLQGFFHGTGHGVGLDCHELPYISNNGSILRENAVVTAEPGLYYIGIGAVRIEDLVIVKNKGIENLTIFEKELEIP